jgi:hypothetical protein
MGLNEEKGFSILKMQYFAKSKPLYILEIYIALPIRA